MVWSGSSQFLVLVTGPEGIRDNNAPAKWNIDVTHLMACLSQYVYKHVIIFITTHLVLENGNLWLRKDKNSKDCAIMVGNVSTSLFYHFILILTWNLIVDRCHFASI